MAKARTEPSTDVVPWDEGDVPAMIEPTPALVESAYAAIFDGKLPPEVGDPAVTARAIQERIRNAASLDEALDIGKLPSFQDYVDKPVSIFAFHLNPSSFEGQHVYAIAEIGDPETGELRTVSCGGKNIVTQLVKAWETNSFPFRAVLRSKPTRTQGQSVLWLERA